MKNKTKAIAAILTLCVIIGAVFAVREYKARIPVITVKEYGLLVKPGDTVDTNELVEVKVKGDYDYECEIEYGHDSCEMDEDGVLHIIDNGQTAISSISLEYSVTGSANRSCTDWVSITVQNPINENNSYEVSGADVSFRVYNCLTDQGNGVFKRGDGFSDNDYEIVFHSSDTTGSMDELEQDVKRYAKEKYLMNEEASDYNAEDVVLSSGKKARKITFDVIRSEGKYLEMGGSGGLVSTVVVYAFGEGGRYFFIDDNKTWGAEYEMEQIANSVA